MDGYLSISQKQLSFPGTIGPIVKYISYICSCPSGHYILMKVFSLLSLDRNLVNFNKNEDKLITPITCRGALCYLHIAIIGVEYRLFVLGLTRASIQINELLHTFLLFNGSRGAGRIKGVSMSSYTNQIDFLDRTIELCKDLSQKTNSENTLFLNLCLGLLIAPQQWEKDSLCQIQDNIDKQSWFINPDIIQLNKPKIPGIDPLSVENVAYHFRNCLCHHHFTVMDNGTEINQISIQDYAGDGGPLTFDCSMSFQEFKSFVLKYAEEKLSLLKKI